MPIRNPVHYNSGTTLNNSISLNQMSFGVENVDYGPTIKTGWYANVIIEHLVIISDSYSQGLTTPENSYPIFWGTTGKTAIAIMSLINGLPARSGLTPFIDPGPAMTWLQSEGKYGILNRTYENIVVSGLTLLYDAGTTLSYPLIDTTVYDLTSGNNDGTLVNGVTYLDTDGGIFNFSSASQQYISFADLGSLSNFTVGCWFNLDSIPNINEYPSLVTDIDSGGNSNYNLGFLATPWDGKITGGFKSNNTWYYPNGFTATTNQWYYVVVSYDGSNVKLYVDGYLYSQTSVAQSAVSSNSGGYIGRSWNGLNYINGNIGIVQIYDRALQSSEIYQNYSSQAPRFSIVLPTPTPTQTVVPTPTPTPTVTQTLTPTSTQQSTPTPTPTITQTQTPTLTQTSTPAQTSTPTPTLTPSSTPPIPYFSGSSVMFIDPTNNFVYKYEPSLNTISYLFSATTTGLALDIAATENKIFINDSLGDIYEYSYNSFPFSSTFSQMYSLPGYIGSGMTAINDDEILIASNEVNRITLSTLTAQLVFSLSADCVTTGDIIYDSLLNQYALTYTNTATSFNYVSVFSGNGETVTQINLSGFTGLSYNGTPYTDIDQFRGIYSYENTLFSLTYNLFNYLTDIYYPTIWSYTEPSNKLSQKVIGASNIASQVAWINPLPNFSYNTDTQTGSTTPTPTVTQTNTPTPTIGFVPETPTPTPTITETNTPTPTTTETNTPTPTVTQTNTPTPTITETNTPTPTVTQTNTPTPTIGFVPETPTPTPTITETNTPTPTVTQTNTPTSTSPETPTPTVTQTNTPTSTSPETPTPTPTVTQTNTPTSTNNGSLIYYQFTGCCDEIPFRIEQVKFFEVPVIGSTYLIAIQSGSICATRVNYSGEGQIIDAGIAGAGITLYNNCNDCITSNPCPSTTPTPTVTQTNTPTPTVTQTNTLTPTSTPTETPTPTVTQTNTPTPTSSSAVGEVVNMTLLEVGSDVVLSGAGTINLTSLNFTQQFFRQSNVVPSGSQFGCGLAGPGPFNCSVYTAATFNSPVNFGTGTQTVGDSGTGDFFGVAFFPPPTNRVLFVPTGYVSGSFISGTTTFNSTTLSTLGATPGTYTWSWGSGPTLSSIIMVVGTPSVTPTNTPTQTVTGSPVVSCNDCRNWQYNNVPVGGDVVYYYRCEDGLLQTIIVNELDTGNFCNCNNIGNPYTDNGTQLTEVGICITPTPTPTPTPTQTYIPV